MESGSAGVHAGGLCREADDEEDVHQGEVPQVQRGGDQRVQRPEDLRRPGQGDAERAARPRVVVCRAQVRQVL